MIELTDTNASGIAAELIRSRTRAGSPVMGMVLTLVIVVTEDQAPAAMEAAQAASHEHPARVIGVILGDGRGTAAHQRPGRHRPGLERRDRADPAQGRGRPARRVRGAPAPAARRTRGGLVAVPPAGRPGRATRSACSGQRRITDAAAATHARTKAMQVQCSSYAPGNTDLAWTRLTRWRALLASALDQQHLTVQKASVTAERISPSADLLVAWLQDRLKVPVRAPELRRAGDHRGGAHHRRR